MNTAATTLRSGARIDPLSISFPVAITIGWIVALLIAPEMGALAYAAPFLGASMCLALWCLYRSRDRRRLTTIILLVVATSVLSLAFRQRELGETGLDWQNGAKLAVWCAIIGMGALRWRDLIGFLRKPLTGLSFAFAAIALLSATWSEVPAYTAASAFGLVAYLILACLAVRDLDQATAIKTILASLTIYLMAGLLAGLIGLDVAWLAPSADETFSRLQGLSGHPNTFGQQAAIFLTLTAISYRLGIVRKSTAAILLAIGLAAILASGSRTNLVAALIAWAVIALRSNSWRHVIVSVGLTLLASFVLLAATGVLSDGATLLKSFSRSGSEGEIFTLTGRTELWATAWNLIVDKPLLGWGYNGIEDIMARSVSAGFEGTAINAHNMALQCIASLGFIGSLPAVAALGVLGIRFVTHPDPARDQIAVLLLVSGLGEVGIAATPILLTIVVFYFFARDSEQSAGSRMGDTTS